MRSQVATLNCHKCPPPSLTSILPSKRRVQGKEELASTSFLHYQRSKKKNFNFEITSPYKFSKPLARQKIGFTKYIFLETVPLSLTTNSRYIFHSSIIHSALQYTRLLYILYTALKVLSMEIELIHSGILWWYQTMDQISIKTPKNPNCRLS